MLPRLVVLLLLFAQTPKTENPALTAARKQLLTLIQAMPTWETDKLAPFEQPELEAVEDDINMCVEAAVQDSEEFLGDIKQLTTDAAALQALDDYLNNRKAI
jgi:hypothetical protein